MLALLVGAAPTAHADGWDALEPGLELRWVVARRPSVAGDSRIAVLRIDPARFELTLLARAQTGDAAGRTAREWAEEHGLVAAINAGMFATDYDTHVGYMESGGRVHSATINDYQSVAAFEPHDGAAPPFRIFDLDESDVTIERIRRDYASLVQNLRLVKRPGENRWDEQEKRWSEAALGEDRDGHVLFVFSRSPFSMHALNRELLGAQIGLVALQHLEGGPEAQLFVHAGGVELEQTGSYETTFHEDDANANAWPIPNVLGVRRKPSAE